MKNSQPLLTIGIPAYNVELFIEETINSVITSRYSGCIEILVVNDGSTDTTASVVKKLSQTYPNVKIITRKNGGHGASINTAIKYANGTYFRLLDGDDWIDTDQLDYYIERLKIETADIVFTDLCECFVKSGQKRIVTYYANLPQFETILLDNVEFPEWGPMLPTTTIKTSLLKESKFKIDEKCYYVDQEYNLLCYLSAKTAAYYPYVIYQYRLERDGQSMEKSSLIRNVKSHETVCKRLLSEYAKYSNNLSAKRCEYLSSRVIIPMCHMQYMVACSWCKSRKDFLSFDKFLQDYPYFYNHRGITGSIINFHRKTNGIFLKLDPIIQKLASFHNHKKNSISKRKIAIILSCLAIIALSNILIMQYVNSEQTVYFWDSSGYWKNSIDLVNQFNTSKLGSIKTVINSLSTDYNMLPLLPLIPFLMIFGTSRIVYILTILNLYIIPFAILMTKTTITLFKNKLEIKSWITPLMFAIFMLTPTVLIPVLNGRPDAICLIVISLIFYLLAKTRLECISNYFTLGLLTLLLIVLRRYFCFFAISLYLSIFIVKSIVNLQKYHISKTFLNKTLKVAVKLIASGLLILIIMFVFLRPLLNRYITGGYNDAYSAYMLGDFFNQINLFIRYYGWLFMSLVIFGIIITYRKFRKTKIANFFTLCIITSVITFLLFSKVQTLGDQHMYMFVPFLSLCVAALVVEISNFKATKYLAFLPIALIMVISTISFTGARATSCSNMCYIFGISETIKPIIRNDIPELNKLSKYLESIMDNTDYVYILSSSDKFNDDILTNLNLPEYPSYNISGVHHVDKRDGFPYYFFDANYVIVADPIQTHLSEGGQDVISYLADQILHGKASNLTKIQSYKIDENIILNVYHKNQPYTDIFLRDTKAYFENKYSAYPFLYETIPEHNNR